jgi:5-formyltetrahydrofolate cyclo-ligase
MGAETGVVAGYYPVRGEFDCLPLLAHLAASGWHTALPAVPAEDGPLEFRAWTPGTPLVSGKFRIPEPAADSLVVRPTVVLAPLLAFDAAGHRLGYGRGYYDRTIAQLRSIGAVAAIGLAFEEQEVSKVPAEQHDERLDWILSPSGARPISGRLPA